MCKLKAVGSRMPNRMKPPVMPLRKYVAKHLDGSVAAELRHAEEGPTGEDAVMPSRVSSKSPGSSLVGVRHAAPCQSPKELGARQHFSRLEDPLLGEAGVPVAGVPFRVNVASTPEDLRAELESCGAATLAVELVVLGATFFSVAMISLICRRARA